MKLKYIHSIVLDLTANQSWMGNDTVPCYFFNNRQYDDRMISTYPLTPTLLLYSYVTDPEGAIFSWEDD